MTQPKSNKARAGEKGISRLLALVEAVRRRFRAHRGELEREGHWATDDPAELDAVTEAGMESFPASDPPSFTPEKST